jgi:hypothetical protein
MKPHQIMKRYRKKVVIPLKEGFPAWNNRMQTLVLVTKV